MNNDKAQPLVGILLTNISLLLFLGVETFAGPCVGVARAVMGVSVVMLILSVVRIFERDEGERRGLCLGIALSGALAAWMPSLLGVPSVRPITAPFCMVVGSLAALVAGADLVIRLVRLIRR